MRDTTSNLAISDRNLRDSFDMQLLKWFSAYAIGGFSPLWLLDIARCFAQQWASHFFDGFIPVAFQVPVANSIAIFVVSAAPVPELEVEQSFGGLFFQKASLRINVQFSSILIKGYMRMSAVEKRPSCIRTSPPLTVINELEIWVESGFKEINRHRKNSISNSHSSSAFGSFYLPRVSFTRIAVAIPVFNSPHHFIRLIRSLGRSLKDTSLKVDLYIADDGSDSFSSETLQNECDVLRAINPEYISLNLERAQSNRGFIASVNSMFRLASEAEIFILLTTDIELPLGWMKRTLRAFDESAEIALATPFATNGANLSVRLRPGQSWEDVDQIASSIYPEYPDAETNVGYCLAVRRSALVGQDLFSQHFSNGYGDDSDLYYRLVQRGFRGVVVDNLVIHHVGGGSFDNLEDVELLRKMNFNRFSEDWMSIYLRRIESKSKVIDKAGKRFEITTKQRQICDLLFVVPTANRKIGGIEAVFRMQSELTRRGLKCQIVSLDKTESWEYGSYRALDYDSSFGCIHDILEVIEPPSVVMATSADTVPYAECLARKTAASLWYFVQGPECAFGGGSYSTSVIDGFKRVDRILCVSEYLSEYIFSLTERTADVVPYGPDLLEFYMIDEVQRSGVAIQFAGRVDKGSDLMGIAVPSLLNAGFEVHAFGTADASFQYDVRVRQMGFCNPSTLRKLFQKVQFYIDLSPYEGLGMLSLEALYCGAIPVTLANGGSAHEIIKSGAGLKIEGASSLHNIGDVLRRHNSDPLAWRAARESVRAKHNLVSAANRLLDLFEEGR